ncbi:MAG TPA: hypothetical protein PK286_06945 [Devosia sp.]|nr:hypothetical protein [Devosia sp.]
MADDKYWFARRHPVGDARNAMAPVAPEGWQVVRTFVSWMTGGAIAAVVLVLLGLNLGGQWWLYVLAAVVYVGCTVYGAWYLVTTSKARGDHSKTVDDYKAGRGA